MKEKTSYELKETLCKHIDDIANKGELSPTTLDQIHKLSDTLKNILKIEMLEEVSDDYGYSENGGYSGRGRYSRDGGYSSSYDSDGYSRARRGQHYVRGHYSRAARYDDDMSNYSRGRYSYADAKEDIIEQMHEIAEQADGKDREMIMRCIKQIESA